MSLPRLLKILTAVALLLAAGIYWHGWMQRPRLQAPFSQVALREREMSLQTGSSQIVLSRKGSVWMVHLNSGPMYKADESRIKAVGTALKKFQVEDEISDQPQDAAFNLTPDRGLHITIKDAQDKVIGEGVFGKQASDFAHIYFKYPDSPVVYLARGVVLGDLQGDVNAWRSKQLIDLPENQVQRILILGPGFRTPLERSSDTWTLNGIKANSTPVWGMIGTFAHLSVEEFVDLSKNPDLVADKLQYAKVWVQTSTLTAELHLGKPDKLTQRYPVTLLPDPTVGWISAANALSLLRKPAEFKVK